MGVFGCIVLCCWCHVLWRWCCSSYIIAAAHHLVSGFEMNGLDGDFTHVGSFL